MVSGVVKYHLITDEKLKQLMGSNRLPDVGLGDTARVRGDKEADVPVDVITSSKAGGSLMDKGGMEFQGQQDRDSSSLLSPVGDKRDIPVDSALVGVDDSRSDARGDDSGSSLIGGGGGEVVGVTGESVGGGGGGGGVIGDPVGGTSLLTGSRYGDVLNGNIVDPAASKIKKAHILRRYKKTNVKPRHGLTPTFDSKIRSLKAKRTKLNLEWINV